RIQLMQRIISSQEDERNRIARELHDSIGQVLTSVKIGMKSVESDILSEGGRKKIEKFRILLDASLEDIHNLAVELRPPLLTDFGLFKAIENYSKEFENNFDIKVHYKIIKLSESYRLPSTIEIGLYRVIQEALTNIAKHANATEVDIIFEKTDSEMLLSISDNGKGFETKTIMSKTERRSLGIFGMQERISILGGNLKIDSIPRGGTKIGIEIPLKNY
ncbi:MAG: sensor histidine kinase, partial [Elusimicrobiota bacterium]|nr:sensor histidine kinase [Elusimicrobiota bacterium]